MMNLLNFPTEIIYLCFENLSDVSDLANSRLVCKLLADICHRRMYRDVTVSITKRSIKRLQDLPENPMLAKFVRRLTFDLSFYDMTLTHRDFWIRCDHYIPYLVNFGLQEMPTRTSEQKTALWYTAMELHKEWRTSKSESCQPMVSALYNMHQSLVNDQGLVIDECADISKLSSVLQRFANLQHIKLTNEPTETPWKLKDARGTVDTIRHVVQTVKSVDVSVEFTRNPYRPHDLKHMRWFLRALCNNQQTLKTLRMDLHCAHRSDDVPSMTIAHFLDFKWGALEFLNLHCYSFHESEIVDMIKSLPAGLHTLHLHVSVLLSGSWENVISYLEELNQVNDLTLTMWCGCMYRRCIDNGNFLPHKWGRNEKLLCFFDAEPEK